MQVTRVGDSWRGSRITGPTHNFLGLKLGLTPPVAPPDLIDLEDDSPKSRLNLAELRRFVLEGVEEANRKFGTTVHVLAMEYASTDTPPEDAYGFLAYRIVEAFLRS